jgi:hypothetical protein
MAAEELMVVIREAIRDLLHKKANVAQANKSYFGVWVAAQRIQRLLHAIQGLRVPASCAALSMPP